MKYFVMGIVAVLSALLAGSALAYVSPGVPTGYVNDYTGTLSQETKATLEGLLTDFQKSGAGELSVVIIPTLNGDSLEEYSITLAREWGIGQQGKNNGTLLLVAKDDRELRIEVGFGNEGTLTDIKSARIIRDVITPRFKEGDYEAGIIDGVKEIIGVLAPGFVGGTHTIDYTQPDAPLGISEGVIALCFVVVILWIKAIPLLPNKPLLRGLLGGVIGALSALIISSTLIVFALACVLTILGITGTARVPFVGSGPGSRWGGGSSSGGSSGFGGFGGGSFGGGGSSGRW